MKVSFQVEGETGIHLDLKDRKLLSITSTNARIPHTQLAKKIGLSKDTIIYRTRRLTEKGIIQGSLAVIDISHLGYQNYHLLIKLGASKKAERNTLIKTLIAYPSTKS